MVTTTIHSSEQVDQVTSLDFNGEAGCEEIRLEQEQQSAKCAESRVHCPAGAQSNVGSDRRSAAPCVSTCKD